MSIKKLLVAALILAMVLPAMAAEDEDDYAPLQQGSIHFRLGMFMPDGESDLWLENTDTFTFQVEDFDGLAGGVELNWFLNKYITVALAIDIYSNSVDTEYRDFIGTDGQPILQEFELTVVPITGTIKFTPLGNGSVDYRGRKSSQIVPWIGAGIGVYPFTYREEGEFIDFVDDSIFVAEFLSEEQAGFGFHGAAGVVVPLGMKWDILGEVRFAVVEADLGDDFIGFEDFDLGGWSYFFGAGYRF